MTKAEILAQVRKRTGRGTGVADIDTELLATVIDVSTQYPFIKTSATVSTTIGSRVIALPSNTVKVIQLLDDEGYEVEENDFERLPKRDTTGKPYVYAVDGMNLYVYYVPDDTYDFTLWHGYTHPEDLDNILLDNRLRECVTQGCMMFLYEGIDLREQADYHRRIYNSILREMADKLITKPVRIVKHYGL